MKSSNGYFIVSLDFELFWGLFDVKKINDYETNLRNVRVVIPRLIELADAYGIKLNFAAIGFLFAKDKKELLSALPAEKPSYHNQKFNPYNLIENIGENEHEDPFHYANSLINLIQNNGNHEIATHTFSHYYVNESGQTINQFEADLKAAITIAKQNNVVFKSIVFPRNQINDSYLEICKKHGIISYRGTEKHWMFDTHNTKTLENPFHKGFRLLDAYINLSGYNTYKIPSQSEINGIINIPSSKFLRPYNKSLSFLESLRINRIKKGMTYAAKENEVYHIWWHPHNFGNHIEENFNKLEDIFKHFKSLKEKYNYKNETIGDLAEQISAIY
jgi:peptidoglycan/xylan/chitin deacetylase (PgdA/CDA1 family)